MFTVGVQVGQLACSLVVLLMQSCEVSEVRWPRPVQALPAYVTGIASRILDSPALGADAMRLPMTVSRTRIGLILLLLCAAQGAQAHIQAGEASGFLSGFMHPISGLDHVLAMFAVGLWGAQLGTRAMWILPVTFPLLMAFGAMLALVGVPLPGVETGIAASALLLGLAVMTERRPRLIAAAVLVGFFAIFHGHAHGTELPAAQSALLYGLGFVLATTSLHLMGIAFGSIHRWRWGELSMRGAGAAIGAAGIFFLWQTMG
jgi:urease accessory protein